MSIFKKIMAISFIALFSMSASAELIKADWQTDGDGLMVADTESGLNWLSLTETAGQSIPSIMARLNSDLDGWRLATEFEVHNLMEAAFPNNENVAIDVQTFNAPSEDISKWFSLFGSSSTSGDSKSSRGWYMASSDDMRQIGLYYNVVYGNLSSNYYTSFYNSGHAGIGVYLVSDTALSLELQANEGGNATSVPLPATSVLLGMGLLAFGARRKKSNDSN